MCTWRQRGNTFMQHINRLAAAAKSSLDTMVQVVCGDAAAAKVQRYLGREPQLSGVSAQVVTVAAETGSADAVRAVADRLSGSTVVVISGDTVTNTSLADVLFTHSVRNAGITTALARTATSASANTKLGKAPKVRRLTASSCTRCSACHACVTRF